MTLPLARACTCPQPLTTFERPSAWRGAMPEAWYSSQSASLAKSRRVSACCCCKGGKEGCGPEGTERSHTSCQGPAGSHTAQEAVLPALKHPKLARRHQAPRSPAPCRHRLRRPSQPSSCRSRSMRGSTRRTRLQGCAQGGIFNQGVFVWNRPRLGQDTVGPTQARRWMQSGVREHC